MRIWSAYLESLSKKFFGGVSIINSRGREKEGGLTYLFTPHRWPGLGQVLNATLPYDDQGSWNQDLELKTKPRHSDTAQLQNTGVPSDTLATSKHLLLGCEGLTGILTLGQKPVPQS